MWKFFGINTAENAGNFAYRGKYLESPTTRCTKTRVVDYERMSKMRRRVHPWDSQIRSLGQCRGHMLSYFSLVPVFLLIL